MKSNHSANQELPHSSVYDISVEDSNHQLVSLLKFKGKVVLIVNTASLCGYTPQYRELQQLYETYESEGLVVLAFPSSQFRNEEPEPIEQVVKLVRSKFGVTFPIMNKVLVNGDEADELYKYLKKARPGKLGFQGVFWNFEKFIIDRNGRVVMRFGPEISPLQFEEYLKRLLK